MSLTYTPQVCWHCGKKRTKSQAQCIYCNGLTMPFRSDGSWKVYVLRVADPTTIKEEELRKLSMAIEGHQNVAILGVASICDQSDQSTAKTSVFLHMADGEEKLSIMDPGKMPKARVRAWENILEHDWDALREIVGDELVVYLLPKVFPKPDFRQPGGV